MLVLLFENYFCLNLSKLITNEINYEINVDDYDKIEALHYRLL